MPAKWGNWIDADVGSYLSPEQDVHTWLETKTHIVDFSVGDSMGDIGHAWPPLIYWPKWKFPRHPREAREKGAILLWRNPRALEIVAEHLAPIVPPITWRAMDILETRGGASLGAGKEHFWQQLAASLGEEKRARLEQPAPSLGCAPPPRGLAP